MYHRIAGFLMIFFFLSDLFAQDVPLQQLEADSLDEVEQSLYILENLEMVARFDSLLEFDFLFADTSIHDSVHFDIEVGWPDSLVKGRLHYLNQQTPLSLIYTPDVKRFIQLYANKRKNLIEKTLGLSELYFPIFEEALDRFEIPLELKYLPVIESGLNPNARSRAGATGLWQFMYLTGKKFGLHVNSYIDDRRDPYLSTEAACLYLKYLYTIYNDWNLALAAYNAGPGNVNKAIRRSGGKRTYWEIRPYLPRETRSYVPAFIAMNYLFNYHKLYGIVSEKATIDFNRTDTLHASSRVIFAHIETYTGLDQETIRFLNPKYRRSVVPNPLDQKNIVLLPKEIIPLFILNSDSIYSRSALEDPELEVPEQSQEMVIHQVRSGEVLGTIAQQYSVRVIDIQEWNNLRSTRINIGQKLVIYVGAKSKPAPSPTIEKQSRTDASYRYHEVRKGDTLWDIANVYEGVSVDDILSLNPNISSKNLKPGQKIKIAKK
jgi:membrane-bound lytic murein transglycosylase D